MPLSFSISYNAFNRSWEFLLSGSVSERFDKVAKAAYDVALPSEAYMALFMRTLGKNGKLRVVADGLFLVTLSVLVIG